MTSVAVDSRRGLRRWLICGAVVVMAHAGLAVALANWHDLVQGDETGNALVIDLAPIPIAVADHPIEDVPPGPEKDQAEPTPEKPVEEIQEKVEEIVRAEAPDVVLPEEVKPEPPRPTETEPPESQTTAPQLPRLSARTISAWQQKISTLLERYKRYPPNARHGENGVVRLSFSLDRQGHVTASRIIESSGYDMLDDESLELVKRIAPFPPPPSSMPGPSITFVVPIRYKLPRQ
jgi:protein TonB